MNTIKLTKEQTRELTYGGDVPDFELVEEGDWSVDHKYQHQTNIARQVSTNKFYEYSISRSGSPFSDYYYSYEDEGAELIEVQKVTKTIVTEVWEKVLDN